jgi:ketosteroid isomerase-like protein
MSSNTEIVREGLAAISRGDFERVLEFADPEIEIRDPDRTGDTFHGHEGMGSFTAEWLENFDDYRIEPKEVLEAADGRIVALCRQSGRGKGSGIEVSDEINMVFRLRDGKAVQYVIFARREDALREAGIESPAPPGDGS